MQVALAGAFVLPEINQVENFKPDGAILPHSGNPCQVDFLEFDPKLQQFCATKKPT
jgi:hypothetical protein